MDKITIIEKIESGAHYFLRGIKGEYTETKQAAVVVQKYIRGEKLTEEDEHIFKLQLVDSMKMVGVMVPFVLVPGASIVMPIIIKMAQKYNVDLMPSTFKGTKEAPGSPKEPSEIK